MDKIQLMYKVLAGHATESEKVELDEWMASDPAIQEDFEDIQFVMNDVTNKYEGRNRNDPAYDGLRKIESRIEMSKRNDRLKRYGSWTLVLAILVFVLTVVVYLFDLPPAEILLPSLKRGDSPEQSGTMRPDNLKFENDTLGEIINTLENKYGRVLEVNTTALLSCRFTGAFYNDISFEDIIRTLAQSIGFDYVLINAQKYELHGKGCNG